MDRGPRLRFALSREVELPKRAGEHEAGIDFFVPKNLTVEDIQKANKDVLDVTASRIVPEWLTADHDNLKGSVQTLPKREQLDLPVNETLIVELYSK